MIDVIIFSGRLWCREKGLVNALSAPGSIIDTFFLIFFIDCPEMAKLAV